MMRGPSEMQSMKALCWGAEATGPLRSVVCAPQNTAFVDCISLRLCAMRFIGGMARVTPPQENSVRPFGRGDIGDCGLFVVWCVLMLCVCVWGGGGPWVGGTWQWLL